MVKIGIVGIGTHAKGAVIQAIEKTSQKAELAAVCDKVKSNMDGLSEKGIATFTDLNEMLATVKLDILYVATTSDAHYETAVTALRAGVNVICEKPMADTVEKCRTMIEEAEKADRKIAVTFEYRYHAEIRKIKEWLAAGYLGKVEAVHVHQYTSSYKNFGPHSARRKRLLDLAGVLDCGIHAFDYIRYLLGGEWIDISARGAWFGEDLKNAPHITTLAQLSSGVMAEVTYSYAYAAYIEPILNDRMLTIVGSEGIITYHGEGWDETELKLISRARTENFSFGLTNHILAVGWMIDDFADVLEGRKEWPPELATGGDGLAAQVLVEEALGQTRKHRINKTA